MAVNLGDLQVSIKANTAGLAKATKSIAKISADMNKLSATMDKVGKRIEKSFQGISKSATTAGASQKKAAKQAEESMKRQRKAVDALQKRMIALNTKVRESGITQAAQNKIIKRNEAAFNQASNALTRGVVKQKEFSTILGFTNKRLDRSSKLMTRLGRGAKKVAKDTETAKKSTGLFADKLQDMSKSIQLALGPLSGVAARLTAFTALANKNTAAIAGFIGLLIGFGAVLGKSIKAGSAFERQMRRIEAQVKATGGSVGLTAEEINQFAIELGEATLTSAKEVRDASSVVLQFSNITGEAFKRVLTAAQGVSEIMGSDLVTNVRRLARALEDPESGLDQLRRAGIFFNEVQREQILLFKATGKSAKAMNIILKETERVTAGAAKGATKGLAGALDTLGERLTVFLEKASQSEGALQSLTKTVNKFADDLQDMNKGLKASSNLGASFTFVMEKLGTTIAFVSDNISFFIALIGTLISLKILGFITGISVAAISATKNVLTLAGAFEILKNAFPLGRILKLIAIIGLTITGTVLLNKKIKENKDLNKDAARSIDQLAEKYKKLNKAQKRAFDLDAIKALKADLGAIQGELKKTIKLALDAELLAATPRKPISDFGVESRESFLAIFGLDRATENAERFRAAVKILQDEVVRLTAKLEKMVAKLNEADNSDLRALADTFRELRGQFDKSEEVLSKFRMDLAKIVSLEETLEKTIKGGKKALDAFEKAFGTRDLDAFAASLKRIENNLAPFQTEINDTVFEIDKLTGRFGLFKDIGETFVTSTGKMSESVLNLAQGLGLLDGRIKVFDGLFIAVDKTNDELVKTVENLNKLNKQALRFSRISKLKDIIRNNTDSFDDLLGKLKEINDLETFARMNLGAEDAEKAVRALNLELLRSTQLGQELEDVFDQTADSIIDAVLGLGDANKTFAEQIREIENQILKFVLKETLFEPLKESLGKALKNLAPQIENLLGFGFRKDAKQEVLDTSVAQNALQAAQGLGAVAIDANLAAESMGVGIVDAVGKNVAGMFQQLTAMELSINALGRLTAAASAAAIALQTVASTGGGGIPGFGGILGASGAGGGAIGLGSTGLDFAGFGGTVGGFVGPFAHGGLLLPGQSALVGEEGTEIVRPLTNSQVIPTGTVSGMGGDNISIVFNIATPDINSFAQSETQIAANITGILQRSARNR